MSKRVDVGHNFSYPNSKRFCQDDLHPYMQVIKQDTYLSIMPQNNTYRASYDYQHNPISSITKSLIPLSDYDNLPTFSHPKMLDYRRPGDDWIESPMPINRPHPFTSLSQPVEDTASLVNEYAYHVKRGTLPKALFYQFQPSYCKLCNFHFNEKFIGKLHYESKDHMKNVRQFLYMYSKETGTPLHPLAQMANNEIHSKRMENDHNGDVEGSIHCDLCKVTLNSPLQARAHYLGRVHQRAEAEAAVEKSGDKPVLALDPIFEPENMQVAIMSKLPKQFASKQDLKKIGLHCDVCDTTVTSEAQLAAHKNGVRHKRAEQNPTIDKFDDFKLRDGIYLCSVCEVTSNSRIQFQQHVDSKKHKAKVDGFEKRLLNTKDDGAQNNSLSLVPRRGLREKNKGWKTSVEIFSKPKLKALPFHGQNTSSQSEAEVPRYKQKMAKSDLGGNNQTPNIDDSNKKPTLLCQLCGVLVISETQLKLHMMGKKHWKKLKNK